MADKKTEKKTFIEHMEAMGISKVDAELLAKKCVTKSHIFNILDSFALAENVKTAVGSLNREQHDNSKMTQAIAGFVPINPSEGFWNSPAQIKTDKDAAPRTMTFGELYDTTLKDVPTVPDGEVDVSKVYAEALSAIIEERAYLKNPQDTKLFAHLNVNRAKAGTLPACEYAVSDALEAAPTRICSTTDKTNEAARG